MRGMRSCLHHSIRELLVIFFGVLIFFVLSVYYINLVGERARNSEPSTLLDVSTPQDSAPVPTVQEGQIIAVNEREIAVSSFSIEPTIYLISAMTPVVYLDDEGNESPADIADVSAGKKAKVQFFPDPNQEVRKAEKIYIKF